MASASYLRQNDYRPQQARPYELPYQATLQEMASKNAFWQQGVSQIQSAYQNVLNLNPQFQQNKDYMKAFMDDATKKIQSLTKKDLGVQDNAAQAAKVYNGIFDSSNPQNQSLLKDDQINKWYQQQEQLSNTARTAVNKQGVQGENWSQANDFYFRQGYNKYLKDAQSGDLSKIEENFQTKKGFIPYYDYSKDVQSAIKNCHKDSSSVQSVVPGNEMYFQSVSSEGISNEKIQSCMSFLPQQAKQQIGIESYSAYFGNKPGLLNDYKSIVRDQYEERRNAVNAKLAAARLNPKATPQDIAGLEAMLEDADDTFNQADKEWTSMVGSDSLNFVDKNFEQIASAVGLNKFIKRAGQSFSWQNIENKVSPNAAGISKIKMEFERDQNVYNQSQQNARLYAQQEFQAGQGLLDYQREASLIQLRAALNPSKRKGSGSGSGGDDDEDSPFASGASMVGQLQDHTNDPLEGVNTLQQSIDNFNQTFNAYKQTEGALNQLVAAKLGKAPGQVTMSERVNFVNEYEKTGGTDPAINLTLQNYSKLRRDVHNQNEAIQAGNRQEQQLRDNIQASNEKISYGVKSASGQDLPFSDKDITMMLTGATIPATDGSRYRIINKDMAGRYTSALSAVSNPDALDKLSAGMTAISSSGFTFEKIGPDGKVTSLRNNKIKERIRAKGLETVASDYNKQVNRFYGQSILEQKGLAYPNLDSKNQKEADSRLKTMLGFGGNDGINVSLQYQNPDGSALAKIYQKTDDGWIPVDMKDVTLPDTRMEKVGVTDPKNPEFIKVPGFLKPLEGYISGQSILPVRNYTQNRLSQLEDGQSSEALPRGQFLELQSPKGIPVKVSVTKIGGVPVYKVYGYVDTGKGKEWQDAKYATPITTEADLLRAINQF